LAARILKYHPFIKITLLFYYWRAILSMEMEIAVVDAHPSKSANLLSATLNVNKLGTGEIMEWPSCAAIE